MDENVLMAEVLDALGNGFEIESVGEVESRLGFYALVETSTGAAIYSEDEREFTHVLQFSDLESARVKFRKIVAECDAYYASLYSD